MKKKKKYKKRSSDVLADRKIEREYRDAQGRLIKEFAPSKNKNYKHVRVNGCMYYIPQGMSFDEWVQFRKELGLST